MVLVRHIPSGIDYTPGDLTSLQVAFDFLKIELGLATDEERTKIAKLVLAAYEQEGRRTHRVIAAVLRVCRRAGGPNEPWEQSDLAKVLSELADEMDAGEGTAPASWRVQSPAEPDGNASP